MFLAPRILLEGASAVVVTVARWQYPSHSSKSGTAAHMRISKLVQHHEDMLVGQQHLCCCAINSAAFPCSRCRNFPQRWMPF